MPKCERRKELLFGCCAFLAQGTSLGRQKAPAYEPACSQAASILECHLDRSTSCDPAWLGVAGHAAGAYGGSCVMVAECLARTVSSWFMPGTRRKDAERLLADREAGAFVLRTTAGGSYCLSFVTAASSYRLRRSFRAEARGLVPTKIVHQVISHCTSEGTYGLQGSSLRFDSVTTLVAFYCVQCDILPGVLVLPPAARDIALAAPAAEGGAVALSRSNRSSDSTRRSLPSDSVNAELPSTSFGLNCWTNTVPDGSRAIPAGLSTPPLPSPAENIRPRENACVGGWSKQGQPIEHLLAPPAPPLRRRRCFVAETAAGAQTAGVSSSVGSGCSRGCPAEAATSSSKSPGTALSLLPPSITSMATVYTTTALLQKPMQLTYDASSDLVCVSSSDDGVGVFSAGLVEISTKAVICIGDSEPSASAEGNRETCLSQGGDNNSSSSSSSRWSASARGDIQPSRLLSPSDSFARQTGVSLAGSCRSNTTADDGAVYHAGALDDRLSDYEDIWSSSSSPSPCNSDTDHLPLTEQQLLQQSSLSLSDGHGGPSRIDDCRRSQPRSRRKDPAVRKCCEELPQSDCKASPSIATEPDALRSNPTWHACAGPGFYDSRNVRTPDPPHDRSNGCTLNLSDHFRLLGGQPPQRAVGDSSSRGLCSASLAVDSLELMPSVSASGGMSLRRIATPGLHRRAGQQQQQQQHNALAASSSSVKVSPPVRCDIIRPAGMPSSQDSAAILPADIALCTESSSRLLLPLQRTSPRAPAVQGGLNVLPLASIAPAPSGVGGGTLSLRQRLLAHDGSDGSDRDSGAIDYDGDDDAVHCSAAVLANNDRSLRYKSSAGVVRTTSLREKATAPVSIQLPLKPQTLPVHLLRKPDTDDASEGATCIGTTAVSPANFESDEVVRSRRHQFRDEGRTPSEIADDIVAEAAAATTGGENGRLTGMQPLSASRCPKFPLSLRLSSGSGTGEDIERAVIGTGMAAAAPRQPPARPSRLLELIETALPDCVLPAICPLTSTNLQRLSTYDNVSPLSQRSGNRLSSGSSSTVFSKPWDASRIEELFCQNARVRSRINTSVLSETSEDCEACGGGDGSCCADADAKPNNRLSVTTRPAHADVGWLAETAVRPDESIAGANDVRCTLPRGIVEPDIAVALSPPELRSPSSVVMSLSPVSCEQPVHRQQQQHMKGTVALRPHHGQAVTQHSSPIAESVRASKYRRSVDFNRDVISARWNSDSSKDPRADDDGDSGTELEGVSQGGATVLPSQKPERSAIGSRKCSDMAKGDIVYNDSHASLQSFSEQIKLMRSPSCAGTWSSNTPTSQLPAVSVQERVWRLASDKKTIFGSAVDNFIQCTMESTEPNPYVILRNIRQFMSGMKNYLTQQGEGSFSDLLLSVQRQLMPNEFLNIDTVLEAALVRCVVLPLKAVVDKAFVAFYTRNGSLKELADGIKLARSKSAAELGMKIGLEPPQGQALEAIKLWFMKMQNATSPVRKLENLLCACSAIFAGMRIGGEPGVVSSLAAEDFLVVMTYVVAHCGLITAEIEADYTRGLLQPSLSSGEGGYYLNVLSSSVAVIKGLARSRSCAVNGGQSTHGATTANSSAAALCVENGSPHTQSGSAASIAAAAGGCAGGLVRIHVPNESTGSILTRTIPIRPSMTAKEIRSMVAHKLFITNPQDYGLYVVVGGVEHRLLDSDTVDNVVGTAAAGTSRPGHTPSGECAAPRRAVVFKRVSAHIVWPSVMS